MAANIPEKPPVAANLQAIQARIDLAIAKRDAIVKSWVDGFDTSRCAPSKTKEELEAWDAELFNPMPSNLGLGASIPKEYLNGDINRKDITGNSKLRSLMLGKKAGLQAAKPRDAEEKANSMKRGLKEESSDEEEGRSNLGKSKKAKREVAKLATLKTTQTSQPSKQTKPLPLQQNTKHIEANSSVPDLFTSVPPTRPVLNEKKPMVKVEAQVEVPTKPPMSSESISKTVSEAEARREKNRLKKEKKKERKRKEREHALAGAGGAKNDAGGE